MTLSPPTTSTSPNWMISPGSPLTLATSSTSSAATRYCLPPVLMTANIFRPRVRFRRSDRSGPASFSRFGVLAAPKEPQQSARSYRPAPLGGLWRPACGPVKKVGQSEWAAYRVSGLGLMSGWALQTPAFRAIGSRYRHDVHPPILRVARRTYGGPARWRASADLSGASGDPGGAVPGRRLHRLALAPARPEARAAAQGAVHRREPPGRRHTSSPPPPSPRRRPTATRC